MNLKLKYKTFIFNPLLLGVCLTMYSQQEDNQWVYEQDSDEFQEYFFEGLKQEGIENYEKALEAFLKAKNLSDKAVVDYKIAQNLIRLHRYNLAENHYLEASLKAPDNQLVLKALFKLYDTTRNIKKAKQIAQKLIAKNSKFNQELAKMYVKQYQFNKALNLLDDLENTYGKTATSIRLREQIKKATQIQNQLTESPQSNNTTNSADSLLAEIADLLKKNDYKAVAEKSAAALIEFPSQPLLYLYNGKANFQLKNYDKATFILENGLDYIFDNKPLEQEFYKTLKELYLSLNKKKKYEEYEKKLKKIF